MRFHFLITHSDPRMAQEEILIEAEGWDELLTKAPQSFIPKPESIRIRPLNVVNPPENFPLEVYIKRKDMR